jgi:KUP system potassium uptake protein
MERPDIPSLLRTLQERDGLNDLDDVTCDAGLETVVPEGRGQDLPRWQEVLFAAMQRNAAHMTELLRLPCEQVVEIGRQVSIESPHRRYGVSVSSSAQQ